jgi:hypothetical protein
MDDEAKKQIHNVRCKRAAEASPPECVASRSPT